MWQFIEALLHICKPEENYHVTTNTLNLMLYVSKEKGGFFCFCFFWDSKTVRKVKAWKSKLTWWSVHVKSGVLPFTFYAALSFAGFSAPKSKMLFTWTAFYPIYHHPVSVSADLVTSVSVPHPTGWMMSSTVPSWKCWGSFQPRWPSCWSCLKGCAILLCFSPKLAHLI